MTKNEQDKKPDWEKIRVKRVLDYHNEKHKTHITIRGRATDVYTQLKGQGNWDLVCYDTETGEEVAVEVKNLTEQRLEKIDNTAYQLLKEVEHSLESKLPGTFSLSANISGDYKLPINQRNRPRLQELLYRIICRIAPTMKAGQEVNLIRRIKLLLKIMGNSDTQFYIPQGLKCILDKISNEGSMLRLNFGLIYWTSAEIEGAELQEFERQVSKANEQLQIAQVKETFLVFIESHSGKEPPEIGEAFSSIKKASYSGIKYVYLVKGEVEEIPLPVNAQ